MSAEVKPNFMKPRWSKVFSDLWGDKSRTSLVVASIAVGVFAVGMIISAFSILNEDINLTYASANPANIEITTDPFNKEFVQAIEKVPGVEDVDGRHVAGIRARKMGENWQGLSLVGIADYRNIHINQLEIIAGTSIPSKMEVVITHDHRNDTGFQVGDEIEIELSDGSNHQLLVVGMVTDQTTAEPDMTATANAFVTMETLRSLGLEDHFNRLYITVDGAGDNAAAISTAAGEIEDKVEKSGRLVYRTKERLSSEHPMTDSLLAIIGVMGALGILITVLSGSLIINTLNALLAQQLRQIGVMKLVGGRSLQILGMYLALIVAYGLIAFFVAAPLGALAGYALANFIATLMSATLQGFRVIPQAIVVQAIIAILIPLGAGFLPVNKGARTNVRRAISNYRPESKSARSSILQRGTRLVRWISRPILLSFRNTFRKKGRLLLTIFTLTTAGAVFIAVFNVRASMNTIMDQLMEHFMGDVTVNFSQPYRLSKVEQSLYALSGISSVEGWGGAAGEVVDENDDVVVDLSIVAPPQDTQLLDPDFIAGRWLLPGENNAMVISDTIYDHYPDLQPGDILRVKVQGNRAEEWEVVGIYRFVDMLGDPMAYATFETVASEVNMPDQATSFRISTQDHSTAAQEELTRRMDQYLLENGYAVASVESGYIMREDAAMAVNTLVMFLLIMAVLTAFVGSIGLTGTMSINVLERTREIGVMRTIGAIDRVIMQSVIIEALVIGVITWVLAIGLSFPISSALLAIIGQTMMGSAMNLTFTPDGLLLWLGIVVILSIIASILPARNAARLTINEVLAYE